MRSQINRLICTLTSHNFKQEQHNIHQKWNIYAACNYEKCTRCNLEKHQNTLYCDKVNWTTQADYATIRPQTPTQ